MFRVRSTRCRPRRRDQSAAIAATMICRGLNSPGIEMSASPTPAIPTAKVQMTSIHPELPVIRRTIQAPVIATDRITAAGAMASQEVIRAAPSQLNEALCDAAQESPEGDV